MKLAFKFLIILISTFLTFNSFAQSTGAAIQKKWMAVDVVGNKQKKENYASRFAKHTSEMEFKAGKFIMYKDGVVDGTATYTVSADGKSVLIKEGQTEMLLKIISLKGNTLQAVSTGFMASKDTIIYQSGAGVKPVGAKANWANVSKSWSNVNTNYQRRVDLISNMIYLLKADSSMDKKSILALDEAKVAAANVTVLNADKLNTASLKSYQTAQDKLSAAISNTLVAAELSPTLKANSNWNGLLAQLEGVANRINVAKRDYNNEVLIYSNQQKKNKGTVEDILFKAAEGSDMAPAVKF